MSLIPRDAPVHLILAGNGTDSEEFQKIASLSPNADRIHLLGYRDDSLGIVASSKVFALASIKGESVTRAVQEAMALGIAPVITDIPGNVELVVHEKSGLVVPMKDPGALADAILRLYHDRELWQKLSTGARDHVATTLSHQRTVVQMLALYESIVDS
jgi:glycosyltransferase involved in cell wall biosynthesis